MERVAFLIEATGERIPALLNPDSVVVKRSAGVRARRTAGGVATGSGLADDPLVHTGGGHTELELALLFDVSLAGGSMPVESVQDLTRPLWNLTENEPGVGPEPALKVVRFVWGKAWNVPGVVTAVAERFEQFSTTGVPTRSWMRLRLVRSGAMPAGSAGPGGTSTPSVSGSLVVADVPEESILFHEVIGDSDAGERLDEIAARYYGEPGLWRLIATFNGIEDPLRVPPPRILRIPPLSAIREVA
jgi:hypothetical protein